MNLIFNPFSRLLLLISLLAHQVPLFGQQNIKNQVTVEGAELKLVFSEGKFTEGPASDASGNVYFTDPPA